MKPERLTLNVVLTGPGTVTVSQPTVETMASSRDWWSMRQSGLAGAIGGTLLGVLGGLIGLLMTWANTRPVAKYLFINMFVFCLMTFIAGIVAACLHQPYHVYYPLLLIGFIGTVVPAFNFKTVLKTLQEDELRKMQALDIG